MMRGSSPANFLRCQVRSCAEDAGSGELLAEAQALQRAFYDLDGKTRRTVALDDLVMTAQVETIEHEEGCGCGLCRALAAVDA